MEKRYQQTQLNANGNTLTGYASVFNAPYHVVENGRSFVETVKPGAFARALRESKDIISTFNHDPHKLLGRTSSGTLRLSEDQHGLRFELDLPEFAVDIRELVKRGDLNGASFMFQVPKGGETWTSNTRTLTDLHLIELGPVAMPASPHTSIGLRSVQFHIQQMRLRELELALRTRITG